VHGCPHGPPHHVGAALTLTHAASAMTVPCNSMAVPTVVARDRGENNLFSLFMLSFLNSRLGLSLT